MGNFGNPRIVEHVGKTYVGKQACINAGVDKRNLLRLAEEQRRPTDRSEIEPLPGSVNMYAVVANKRSVI